MAANPLAPLVVVVGETASGKSALALELAERFGGEIICADSWTVYKGFDIGTAKPSNAERARVPHHLLDVADPAEGFSAPRFQRLAYEAMEGIAARDRVPIVVGGTGLYIDSILYDYSFLPKSDPELRKELNDLSLEELITKSENMELDTAGIDLRNKRRVIRLIENDGKRPTKQAMRPNTLIIGIKRPLEELQGRIVARIDAMVAAGFADEVRHLGERYGWDCEPMQAPGYRAFADYVQGKIVLADAKERFKRNDLQLAKKQRTWFKRNKSIQWMSTPIDMTETVELVTSFLNK